MMIKFVFVGLSLVSSLAHAQVFPKDALATTVARVQCTNHRNTTLYFTHSGDRSTLTITEGRRETKFQDDGRDSIAVVGKYPSRYGIGQSVETWKRITDSVGFQSDGIVFHATRNASPGEKIELQGTRFASHNNSGWGTYNGESFDCYFWWLD